MASNDKPETVAFQAPKERLSYTGERFTSGQGGPIEHEHRHRYLIAASICRDKDVLDIASGEGFGSAFLASVARTCTGVDIDPEAIAFARRNYHADNLEYCEGSATAIPLADASVDVVVSFETIEHFPDHETFMREARRVLRPNGVMLISSPNRGIYDGTHNHFHVRELTQEEFLATLSGTFANHRLIEQKATSGSIIAPVDGQPLGPFRTFLRVDDFSYEVSPNVVRPPYSLILASDAALPDLDWGLLDDEGYTGFLQRWIANSDAHHEAINAGVRAELEAALEQKANVEKLYSQQLANNLKQGNEGAKRVARFGLQHASIVSEGLTGGATSAASANFSDVVSELTAARKAISELKSSTSWRVSAPLRAASQLTSSVVRAAKDALRSMRSRNAAAPQIAKVESQPAASKYLARLPASQPLVKRVLIVADTNLKQCAKYRVWQKKAAIESVGLECTVINWGDSSVRRLMQTHAAVIFYRVPGWPESLDNMREAQRLGIPVFWEVDDLIFDLDAYQQNRNLDLLDPKEKQAILSGTPLFREALLACGKGIASTTVIAEYMKRAGVEETIVIQNALDHETLAIAEKLRANPRPRSSGDEVVIFYGSGSRSHDMDFRNAAEGIERLLDAYPNTRLKIAGALHLPETFDRFGARVERAPMADFEAYLAVLSTADISIAPLETSVFNDAKSNIKFLESAVLGVPSVCSPRLTFTSVVRHGENGFLAATPDEWFESLAALVRDPQTRRTVGERARQTVLDDYSPDTTAKELAPLLAQIADQERKALNVLTANIYFDPQSFGGATIVCEQLVHRLHKRDDTKVSVFTSLGLPRRDYDVVRYDVNGVPVLAAKMPAGMNRYLEYENYKMARVFQDVLEGIRPDIVHLHSIQGLGASIADACLILDIPYVITAHDAWWLCERQFMVDVNSRYCGQKQIDLAVCARCVPNIQLTKIRTETLQRVLENASMVLTPSEFSRELHISNGVSPDRIRVNRNGVAPPRNCPRKSTSKLRFGFVGGVGGVKGLDVILKAFDHIEETNYELVLVDNTMNLGVSSMDASKWNIKGTLTIRPAYAQAELDEFFSQIDVLLFPSQAKESFGLTVREALIRDVWVIATEAGGAVEDIQPGVNGDILPFTSDHGPLRDAIRALLNAPERLSNFRNPLAHRIRTYDQQAAELRDILHETIEAHGQKMRDMQAERFEEPVSM